MSIPLVVVVNSLSHELFMKTSYSAMCKHYYYVDNWADIIVRTIKCKAYYPSTPGLLCSLKIERECLVIKIPKLYATYSFTIIFISTFFHASNVSTDKVL